MNDLFGVPKETKELGTNWTPATFAHRATGRLLAYVPEENGGQGRTDSRQIGIAGLDVSVANSYFVAQIRAKSKSCHAGTD